MLLDELLNEIDELVGDAMWSLLQSRVYEQEAIIHDELDALYGPNHYPYNMGDACRRLAKTERLEAKRTLKKIEILNGQLYLRGGRPTPLNVKLNGSVFRCWPAYAAVYADSPLLKGVDPA